jgi:SPX domain protein involved in polyphosphate accumulation
VTNIYKILQNKRVLPTWKLNFINYNEYKKAIKDKLKKEEEAKEYIQNLSWRNFIGISGFKLDNFISEMTEIRKDVENFAKMDVLPLVSTTIVAHLKDETEFGMLKAELKIK